ncbi:B12-binding domain-containing radical SAM protein [bacterium]|nr:B12-binding domain-containing radical SAM protein [bacterium]MDB4089342.1 B12-binding domain-containing radical SAM protein [Flavobacteriales bacterium]
MNVLLTHGYFLHEDEKEKAIMRPYPPLGILYLSGYLKDKNINHQLFDSTFSSEEEWVEYALKHKPKLIAFYTNLMTKVKILHLIDRLKKSDYFNDTKFLLGGPDVTYNIKNYMKYGADFIVIGEGEETFHEMIIQFEGEKEFDKVNGLVFKDKEGVIVKNPPRVKIKDINELSFPNRKGIDLAPYLSTWKTHHGKSTINISTQRGCPYTCKWCSTAVYGQSYRRRSPKLVVDEIVQLKKDYNPDALWFVDDVFTVSHKWLNEFHKEMTSRNVSIQFECITRAERLNEEVLQKLKEIGCFRIWIGAESGSQRIIDKMDRKVDINVVKDMIQLTTKMGMESGTFIMLGYPTETMEDINLTIQYLKDANPDVFTITVAYPIKGTSLYTEIEKDITKQPAWNSSTDREIDFERTYSRKFYDYAVRKVVNEVNGYKMSLDKKGVAKITKMKAKSFVLSALMKLNK